MPNGPFYEAGRYEGQIIGQRFAKAKSGNTQFVITFKVTGKLDMSDPDKIFSVPAQYERSIYRTLTDKTIEYFFEDMKSLGIENLASFGDMDPLNPGFIDLKGRVCDFTCSHEQNPEGGMREKWYVARVNSGGGKPPIESLASQDVRNLDRLFGKHLKKPASGAAPRQAPAAVAPPRPMGVPYPAAGEGITDDDVPF